jgi:glutathione S-transferase
MLFYDSVGPNPRVVRMFAAERGITIPKTTIDMRNGENRQAPYLMKNPAGTLPCLELDDGTVLAETTAICEYLDEISPGLSLIGVTPKQRAECRMWVRRIDLNIVEPMANGFRFSEGLKLLQDRMRCIPEAAPALKLTAQENLTWLDGLISGRSYICGDRLTLADIFLFCFLDFGAAVGQPLNPDLHTVNAHYAMMKARPTAAV